MHRQAGDDIAGVSKLKPAVVNKSLISAALITFTGGFLDAFTYVGHGGVFANSMTGNIVLIGVLSSAGKWAQVGNHIPPLIAFLAGIFVVYKRQQAGRPLVFQQLAIASIFLEIMILLIFSLLPASFPGIVLVSGIALVASIQYESFSHIEQYTYNSVTVTVNLRRYVEAVCDHSIVKTADSKHRRRLFAVVSIAFFTGAMTGGEATRRMENMALLIPVAALAIVWWLMEEHVDV